MLYEVQLRKRKDSTYILTDTYLKPDLSDVYKIF